MSLDTHMEVIPDWLWDSIDDVPSIVHISYFDDDKTDLTIEELDMSKPTSIIGLTDWVSELSDMDLKTLNS